MNVGALQEVIAAALKERATTFGGLVEWDKLAETALEVVLGEIEQKEDQIEAMAQDLIRQQKQIEMLQGAFGDMAATIRRLTDERIGPENHPDPVKPALSLYGQLKERGIVAPVDRGHTFDAAGVCIDCGRRAADIGNTPPCEGPLD